MELVIWNYVFADLFVLHSVFPVHMQSKCRDIYQEIFLKF